MPTTRPGPRRAARPSGEEHPVLARRGLLAVGAPVVAVLLVGAAATYQRLTVAPAPPPAAVQARWRYEVHVVVPLPARSPQRDDVLSTVTLVEEGLRPALAAVGARMDTDDEGDAQFTMVALGNDLAVLSGVLGERGRVLPAGTRMLVYGWAPDGVSGPPLGQRRVGGTP